MRGRDFTESESRQADRVAILNRTAARIFFGSDDPVGRRFRFVMNAADESDWWTVVGVAEDILFRDSTAVIPAARDVLGRVDPEMAYQGVTTGRELRAHDIASERALAVVLGLFTALALVLSSAGLWATVAQSVAERRREIGVRMALGAEGRAVRGLFVWRLLVPVIAGGAAGTAVAALLSGSLEGVLFGVGARDARVFGAALGTLLIVACAASWMSARAATRVDPVEVLRGE